MTAFFQYLNSLYPLSAEATAALLKVIRTKELRRGQVWLQEGAVCDKMSFVVKGLMKLYCESGSKEVVLQFAKEGDCILSAHSYFGKLPSKYSIRSVEPSIIIYLQKSDLDDLLGRYLEMNILFRCIAEKQASEYEAHSNLLMLSLRERYERFLLDKSWVVSSGRISDKLLSAYLGMTPNSFCGIKKLA